MTTQSTGERIPQFTQGDRLRKARALTGMTTREFADVIGVSHGTVTNAEGDKREVRRITLNAWALATGVPVSWLEHGHVEQDDDPQGPDGGNTVRATHRNCERVSVLEIAA